MTRTTILKLALLVVGLFLFAYGVRERLADVRWAGIAFIAIAFLMRLVERRAPPKE